MVTQTKIPSLKVSNPWWGHDPSDKQWLGLYGYEECPDLFYGGAALALARPASCLWPRSSTFTTLTTGR